jgi:carbamoyltransferase
MFIQPAAGDAGCALGAAALAYVHAHGRHDLAPLEHVFLGPAYSDANVRGALRATGTQSEDFGGNEPALIQAAGQRLSAGEILGWFQGRMEFGPRALGARSILADPRRPSMQDRINQIIKERESFRPFAPAVLESEAPAHFQMTGASPFMLQTYQVRSPIPLPAVTHVDGSARVQTVGAHAHPRFARLLEWFHANAGSPVLLNTSFNLQNEPIVGSPIHALTSFTRSKLDALVLENHLVTRAGLSPEFTAVCQAVLKAPAMLDDRRYTFW